MANIRTSKTRRARSAPAVNTAVTAAKSLFNNSGAWATRQLQKALREGKALSAGVLRTADVLRKDEWRYYDQALVKEAVIRLVGVADLIGAGLVTNVPNALGKLVLDYEKITDMDPAQTSLDGLAATGNDVQEFDLNQLPLPITHKDFFINLRKLEASRNGNTPIDTTNVATAGRVVAEQLEKMLFQGGPTFGGIPIYGYTTLPDANVDTFDGGKDWGNATKTGTSYLADLLNLIGMAHGDRMFGPYMLYIPSDAGVLLDNDYNAGTANIQSIRQRLLQVENLRGIRTADQLPSGNVVLVQMTQDVAKWVQGEQIQTVQWDESGGFRVNFKAFAIGVPLLRSDAQGRCGISRLHA